MRVKIGDKWFKCEPGQPIMIELTHGDKRNIAEMTPLSSKYAIFDDSDKLSVEEKYAWMNKE